MTIKDSHHRRQQVVLFLATGFGTGRIKVAPGTWGTLPGLALALPVSFFGPVWQPLLITAMVTVSVWIAHEAELILGAKDPGAIVIDEMAGVMVALCGLPLGPGVLAAGFVVFRFFDILKPFPIRQVERRFQGGCGVVLDDIVAGLYTGLVLRIFF